MKLPEINTWNSGGGFADNVVRVLTGLWKGRLPRAVMGWNGIVVWDKKIDPVDMLDAWIRRMAAESCGECAPCRLGTQQLTRLMDNICRGKGSEGDLQDIRDMAELISMTARCDLGKTFAKPVLDLLGRYALAFDDVIHNRRTIRKSEYAGMVTAPCINACPSHVDIPDYLENARKGRWPEAMEIIRKGCPLPGTIGRVCVRPCETACRRKDLDAPLAIRGIKRFLSDREQFMGMRAEEPRVGEKKEKIAIVGAGPAGLSCAYYLGRLGYKSTIFEAQEGPGGMAAYGIPSYRLPRDVIAHEVSVIKDMGVDIRYGVEVGKDIRIEDMADMGYDAVFLAVGAPVSSAMRCKGEDEGYEGFMTGIDFLAESARGRKPLSGKRVAVIGGGNVAMDCVRTARRLGFDDVNLLYRRTETEMPADRHEIIEAREEGVHFHFLVAPLEIMAGNHRVTGIRCQKMELGEPDASGRRSPVPVEGSDFIIPCDAVIPAVGQKCVVDRVLPDKEVLTSWKTLVVDQATFQSGKKNIFGGGDCITGPATLIAALAAGKNAARFISQYLENGICEPEQDDFLDALVSESAVFNHEEPYPFPGYAHRAEQRAIDPHLRVRDFGEVEMGFEAYQVRAEASRCLRCYRLLMYAM